MVTHQRGLAALYVATVILAISGVLSKSIPLDAISITFLRCVIALMTLCIILRLQKANNLFQLHSRKSYGIVVIVGSLMAIHWSSFFHAMQVSTVAIGILAHYSFPVITVIIEPLLNKKRPLLGDIIAALIVLAGVALMVPSWELNTSSFTGVTFGLLSAFTWSSRNIIQRRWLAHESGQSIMTYQLLVIALLTLTLADYPAIATLSKEGWLMLALLGIVVTACGHTLVAISLRVINAKSVGLIFCLQPPLAIALSWLLLAEKPDIKTIIGGGIILAAALYEANKTKASG